MTLLTVSNQGFTVHNHMCGINFLSHLRGAPHNSRQTGMRWDTGGGGPREARLIAGIAEIARHRRNRKRKTQLLPLINTDDADRNKMVAAQTRD
jgi:hypothetical protein